jgi:cytoskeletal protein CcmA (bactofilin family)
MADQVGNTTNYATTIGTDAVFKGNMKFQDNVRLLGQFEGAIETSGSLLVAKGAVLQGEIRACDVIVAGNIKGNVHATGKLTIDSTAQIEGELHVARLQMSEGAAVSGQCVVGANRQPGKSPRRSDDSKHGGGPTPHADGEPKKKGLLQALGV